MTSIRSSRRHPSVVPVAATTVASLAALSVATTNCPLAASESFLESTLSVADPLAGPLRRSPSSLAFGDAQRSAIRRSLVALDRASMWPARCARTEADTRAERHGRSHQSAARQLARRAVKRPGDAANRESHHDALLTTGMAARRRTCCATVPAGAMIVRSGACARARMIAYTAALPKRVTFCRSRVAGP